MEQIYFMKRRRIAATGMALLIGISNAFTYADSVTINFSDVKTSESKEPISSSELLKFLDATDPNIVESIPFCEGAYGYPNGIAQISSFNEGGALYIQATDPTTGEDTGMVSFKIKSEYLHKNTNLNLYVNVANFGFDETLEVSINGGAYQEASVTIPDKNKPTEKRFNIKPNNQIIKELSIKVPNPCRINGEFAADSYLNYYMAFTSIGLFYSASETSEPVSSWTFDIPSDSKTAYLNSDEDYELPKVSAIPEDAALFAEYVSSNPAVAAIENGKIVPKSEGQTTITASLAPNHLFTASAQYAPASYELVVKKSTATNVESVSIDESSSYELYDLSGRRINGIPEKGIYIKKSKNSVRKITIF